MQPPGNKPSEDSAATTDRAARYRPALAAATALFFFIWGFLTSLNDILIPQLKGVFDLGYAGGAFVQVSFFSAYSWCRSRPARSSRRSVTSVASCSGSPSPGLARCSSIPRRAVQWLAEHTGLIRFEGTGDDEQIRFWHRLFREYLAARQLARQNKVVRVLVDELWESNCLVDPFWGDVIQLLPRALGTSEKALSLIQGLQELAAAHAPARGRLLGLAAACMIESRDLFPGVNFASQAKDLAKAYESEGLTWAFPDRQLVLGKLALLDPDGGDPRFHEERWITIPSQTVRLGDEVGDLVRENLGVTPRDVNMQRAAKSPNSSEPPRRQDAKLLNFLAPWRLGGCFFGFLAGRCKY